MIWQVRDPIKDSDGEVSDAGENDKRLFVYESELASFLRIATRDGKERDVKAVCTNDWLLCGLAPGSEVNVCVDGSKEVVLGNYFR